ncbi:uncharacterized protein VP01_2699g1 [Puccinia sorghi]|uniref:Reverse transcriptase Ty1/copia-type domain-containing protein n=1 Tax=Puccinia sorghi TaxID=27349 RepID=A0A0L6V3U6_9BASI|nr:uncharacterized protein VP01_2699g1 [Puccinia sorghi]
MEAFCRSQLKPPVRFGFHHYYEPNSFESAIRSADQKRWREAISKEVDSIDDHGGRTTTKSLRILWIPLSTWRMMLLYSLHQNLDVTQFDVQGAFLHAPLSEAVFSKTPKGVNRDSPYLKLKKALDGLKHAPPQTATPAFLVGSGNNFKSKFQERFKNSSCHEPNTILGMKFERIGHKILLSQPKQIEHGLEELGLTQCKPSQTPLTPNDSWNYIAVYTRPDISFAVRKVWKYLKCTRDLKLTLEIKTPSQLLDIYSDASWGPTQNIKPCSQDTSVISLAHQYLGTVLDNTTSLICQLKLNSTGARAGEGVVVGGRGGGGGAGAKARHVSAGRGGSQGNQSGSTFCPMLTRWHVAQANKAAVGKSRRSGFGVIRSRAVDCGKGFRRLSRRGLGGEKAGELEAMETKSESGMTKESSHRTRIRDGVPGRLPREDLLGRLPRDGLGWAPWGRKEHR